MNIHLKLASCHYSNLNNREDSKETENVVSILFKTEYSSKKRTLNSLSRKMFGNNEGWHVKESS